MWKKDVSTEKNACFNGVSRVRKKVVSTVRKKMFQRCFRGERNTDVSLMFLWRGKRCVNGISTVRRKLCFKGVEK